MFDLLTLVEVAKLNAAGIIAITAILFLTQGEIGCEAGIYSRTRSAKLSRRS